MKTLQDYLPSTMWLMKSEPDVFSLEGLMEKGTEFWDGVRNYQARNFMTQHMQVGHQVLFYHSNATPTGVAGMCEIVEAAKPDTTALNPHSLYFDEKSSVHHPRWYGVTVGKPVQFKHFVSLAWLRTVPELQDMLLLRKGQRLSIMPVSEFEFHKIKEFGMKGT